MFRRNAENGPKEEGPFGYLPEGTYYFDSACQTLRPQSVIDAEIAYYRTYNACGGRVKYPWGTKVDDEVTGAREKLLSFAGKSEKEYFVAFTLNTTYGINLVLQQLSPERFDRIVTSDIEHNSVFLPSITWSKRHGKKRTVLSRSEDGSLQWQKGDFEKAVVILNTTSNIDGRELTNVRELADAVHAEGGILLLDAAQTLGHGKSRLQEVDFDAAFGSGHKMYGPSLGVMILKRTLVPLLEIGFIGGGTVSDVQEDTFDLIDANEEPWARLELGLQSWAGIIGLGAAVDWLQAQDDGHEQALAAQLTNGLSSIDGVHLLNTTPSSIASFFVDTADSHRIAMYLGQQQVMCRSGYFCCHYYLLHKKQYPPLLRVSLGLNNTPAQVDHFLKTLTAVLNIF